MAKVTIKIGFWVYFCSTFAGRKAGFPSIENVRGSDLLSKKWCELVFEGKNKAYGAYRLRAEAGRRYARALWSVLLALVLLIAVPLALDVYVKYHLAKSLEEAKGIARMRPLPTEKDHELKAVSAGRRAVKGMKPGATLTRPEIVDQIVLPRPVGIDGPELDRLDEELLRMADADTFHNTDRTDLPVEGIQLTPTEVVEQMPEFPGGLGELMKWLDRNVVYPKSCVDRKIAGELEVSFYVMADGTVSEPAITKPLHPDLDRAVLMAVKRMPRWKPGRVNGRVSIVRVTVPVSFQLQ